MELKTNRKITVYRSRRSSTWPSIILDGKWLHESGFALGDKISVHCEEGKLTIENTGRRWYEKTKRTLVCTCTFCKHCDKITNRWIHLGDWMWSPIMCLEKSCIGGIQI